MTEGVYIENSKVGCEYSIVLCNPGEVHRNYVQAGTHYRILTFYPTRDVVGSISGTKNPLIANGVVYDVELFTQFYQLFSYWMQANQRAIAPHSEILFRQSVHQLLRACQVASSATSLYDSSSRLERAKRYITEHANEKITLDELAALTSLSRFQLVRQFKAHTGFTPFEYVNFRRVSHARILILQGLSPLHAGIDAGFYDQSHLIKYFKKIFGITPTKFQQSCNMLQS